MLSPPRKALLCIHGAGTSGAIFRVQIAKLSAALRHEFDFVYVTAPHSTSPGPGVIPFFASMGPFYSWFRDTDESISHRLDAIYKPIQQKVGDWQLANPNSRIVGMLAFSEGALVAAVMLWQQQRRMGQVSWLPDIHFTTFICCFYREEVTKWMREQIQEPQGTGAIVEEDIEKEMKINIPTLHLLGKQDFVLSRAKMLIETHYTTTFATVMEFDGQHAPPSKREDIEKAAALILESARSI
jgi:hypothetical protein